MNKVSWYDLPADNCRYFQRWYRPIFMPNSGCFRKFFRK